MLGVYFVPCGVSVCLQLPHGAMKGLGEAFPLPRPRGAHQKTPVRQDSSEGSEKGSQPHSISLNVPTPSLGNGTDDLPASHLGGPEPGLQSKPERVQALHGPLETVPGSRPADLLSNGFVPWRFRCSFPFALDS